MGRLERAVKFIQDPRLYVNVSVRTVNINAAFYSDRVIGNFRLAHNTDGDASQVFTRGRARCLKAVTPVPVKRSNPTELRAH